MAVPAGDVAETAVSSNGRFPTARSARGGKPPSAAAAPDDLPPQIAAPARGGKTAKSLEVGVVANDSERVVAKVAAVVVANDDDDDDGEVVGIQKPASSARIEVRKRKRSKGHVYIIGWRWQIKNDNGTPCRTASGGYKRGFSYVKTVGTKQAADRIKAAAA